MSLTIEVEDIYFITGLSRWGEVVNLRSRRPGGGLTIDEYQSDILFSRHGKGWESNPDKLHTGAWIESHTIGTRQDSRASLTPPGLAALNVLCSGVHETHSLRLEYFTVE